MKEKIIEIIGFGMEPERTELKAREVIILFNFSIVEALKSSNPFDIEDFVNKIFIKM